MSSGYVFFEGRDRLSKSCVPPSGRLILNVTQRLEHVLETLRSHENDLRSLGVSHAAVFGSVARGEAGPESDVDVLVDLDESRPIGVFEYSRIKLYLGDLLSGSADVVNRRTIKPLLRDSILRDAVNVF